MNLKPQHDADEPKTSTGYQRTKNLKMLLTNLKPQHDADEPKTST